LTNIVFFQRITKTAPDDFFWKIWQEIFSNEQNIPPLLCFVTSPNKEEIKISKSATLYPFTVMWHAGIVLRRGVGMYPRKLTIFKQLRTHFKAKHEKSVRTQFPNVPAPLHP